MSREIPLFPLNTVLFPGGPLSLRIFEPRYLDMVSERLRLDEPFGVVLIREGQEVGSAARFHEVGTLARIVDFDRLEDGLLGITCRGEGKFRVLAHHVRHDQLVLGEIEHLPEEPRLPIGLEHQRLRQLLWDILGRDEVEAYRRLLSEDWDSAAWLGYRLSELLPMPLIAKQALLELEDPTQRLALLHVALQPLGEQED
ncbi:MAG TPA: LON peptidase substrate-binding domain-containing protein [Candidatus Competibacteraceae bacterium]|nr:LON peptidase substrate-binding domain-containing protein [Candidatus Competibacteraceae bacterium]